MLTLYEKMSVDRIIEYLTKVHASLQGELNVIESDIVRTKKLIDEAKVSKSEIQESVDSSYMVLSSSQVAKSQEFAEIDSFEQLIEMRRNDLDQLNRKKLILEGKLSEVNEIISCAIDLNK